MNAKALRQSLAANPWIIAVVVSLATFMEVLDTTIVNVSVTHMAGSLAATPDEGTWVLTSYLVANGIVLPISGWLSDVLGRKRFFISCIIGFTAASLACGLADSLPMLIVCRMFQGLFGGGLQPMQQAIVLDSFPPAKRGAAFGLMGITLIVAPVIGPTLGGWITDTYSWRWVFLINVPVGLLAAFLVSNMVHDPEHAKAKGFKNVDYIGLGLIALGFAALQIMLDKGQTEDWFHSDFIIMMACIAGAAIIGAIAWLLTRDDPIVDLTLFKERSFALGTILIFFTGFALYGSSALLPLLVQTQFGYDATLAGLVLSPAGVLLLFLMPLSGQLVSKVAAKYLILIGLTLCGVGMFYTAQFTPQTDYHTFVVMRVVQMVGLPFLFIPVSTLAFSHIPKEKSGKSSALFALARNLGGSVGIAIAASHVVRMSQTHQGFLSRHAVPGDPVYETTLGTLTQNLSDLGAGAESGNMAMGLLYRELIKQSSILGYQDTFYMMAALMFVGVALALFLPRNDPKAQQGEPMGH